MSLRYLANRILAQEGRALLTRLERVKPFALLETMVPAANVSLAAQAAIEQYLIKGRQAVYTMVTSFLSWLNEPGGRLASPEDAQRRFSFLRLQFNAALDQFDIFADVMSQRSEHETGVWLAGLDVVAADALSLPKYYQAPAVACYLDRGFGAAIRRARTRLPGGGWNPVAIIRVPRERMVGSGIASSLVHEVGHQASALLDLVASLRPVLRGLQTGGTDAELWRLWERWISEILSDFWSVAKVGIAATLGLMGVVTLPRPFIFRINVNDPHPVPWIRVKLSCAMGEALYPHPQWTKLGALWSSFYPTTGLDGERTLLLSRLETAIPAFVSVIVNHRPKSLRGATLKEVLGVETRQPSRLSALYRSARTDFRLLKRASPTVAFAAIGQARVDGTISPEEESKIIAELLKHWALRSTLVMSEVCAALTEERATALST